ncbi:MAG: class I SAM-dependent methyltransferase [Gammaproteobacteria bacterium]|nr:class I SAM-dependent methyltransferase [Gammaproteobacteria bacterium]MBU1655980.1 class I SAM-dependent methyltransferase [Gammaproteobacteria bacterium]MBU1962564.1 class I SAM-dependent methyltransferase [Gammaproteobacteria bacterium]
MTEQRPTGNEGTKRFYDQVGWLKQEGQTVDFHLFGMREDGPIRMALHEVHLQRVRSALSRAGKRISLLECGCGGNPARDLFDLCCDYTGVDFSETGLDLARDQLKCAAIPCDVRQADVCALPFDDGRFDAIYSAHMLYHIPEAAGQRAALHEMLRVLRPGGVLVLITANPRPLLFPIRLLKRLVADTPAIGRMADIVRRAPPIPYRVMPLGWVRQQVGPYGSFGLMIHSLPSAAFNRYVTEYRGIGKHLWRLIRWLDLSLPCAAAHLGCYVQITLVKSVIGGSHRLRQGGVPEGG